METANLRARYYRHFVDPGRPNTESNLEHVERTLPLPTDRTALVLVDCWDDHHNDGLVERMRPIIDDHLAPALAAARDSEVLVVHCPSPDVSPAYPEFHPDVEETPSEERGSDGAAPDWPPADVRDREGAAEAFARTEDERAREARNPDWPPWEGIDPALEPIDGECVVPDGETLHALLADRGRTRLVYAGFHTNICVQHRDYGMRAMSDRGYPTVLLRDCTCAVESHDTVEAEWHRRIAVRDLEVQVGWSSTSAAFRAALGDETA
ncbi:MAG: cysteine hydrolase family protein [Halobacteriaceae archaeon]